jgi:ubiquinone/menaquinone biosynthesis C-methylase UbiE
MTAKHMTPPTPAPEYRLAHLQPELGAGNFPAHDGTIEFYGRVRALLQPGMLVVDFGAGRAAWAHDDPSVYRRRVRDLRDMGVRLVGCDVDKAIESNPVLEQKIVIAPGQPLPYADASVDLVIADYVLEHLPDPKWFAREMDRVLKPGGWVCGRTPPKWHYVVMASRLLPGRLKSRVLGAAQKDRKSEDVFPAYYRLNSPATVRTYFPPSRFDNFTYNYHSNSPSYHFDRAWIYRTLAFAHAVLPSAMHGNLFVFLRKKAINPTKPATAPSA